MNAPPGGEVPPVPATAPPDALGRALAFARAITGTLRPPSVIERLLQELKATFAPRAILAVTVDEQGLVESANAVPHPALDTLLREVLQTGTPGLRILDTQVALMEPLAGRRRLIGAIGVLLDRDPGEEGRRTLAALAAITSVALEGARLVESADQRHQTWEEATDTISLALCVVDRFGQVERANRAFSELVAAPPTGVIGRSWTELVPAPWQPTLAEALANPGPAERLMHLGPRTIAATTFRATASGRAVLLLEDQTERRLLQDRLLQAEKLSAIGQLIAGVAHDLNNPLTSVVGFADFLAESADTPPRIREPLRVIQQEAERASKIVKNLLSFARRQETRQLASLQPVLEATIGLFRNHLDADRVTLELEIGPDLPDLDLNPNQIQQVFVNLIQNAAHAIAVAGRPGTIRVSARRWMDGAAVEIRDDGCGMDGETLARIFEPFFTTKPPGQGTGLGLSISQGIVKEHGGRITASSTAGTGSCFTVELPGPVGVAREPAAAPEGSTNRPLRVLVVDDEQHILHYMRATLEAWGHEVATVSDGEAALERATTERFDLILSDLRMPRAGGREFYEALTRRAPDVARRVAFSTGDTVRGDTLRFLEAQGRPILQKPFSLAELRALLREAAQG